MYGFNFQGPLSCRLHKCTYITVSEVDPSLILRSTQLNSTTPKKSGSLVQQEERSYKKLICIPDSLVNSQDVFFLKVALYCFTINSINTTTIHKTETHGNGMMPMVHFSSSASEPTPYQCLITDAISVLGSWQ